MAPQEALAEPVSWEGRSYDQLREIVDRGLTGGDDFVRAAREMERRSREFFDAEEVAQVKVARTKWRRRLIAWVAMSVVGLVGVIGLLLVG